MPQIQDDSREKALIKKFNLTPMNANRIGIDATLGDFNFELKTSSKGGISTARDVGLNHIEKWEKLYWIVAVVDKEKKGFGTIYLLKPENMKDWIDKIKNKLTIKYDLIERCGEYIVNSGDFLDEEVLALKSIMKRGITLNDPNIPKGYIETHWIKLSSNNYSKDLRKHLGIK